MEIFRIVTCKTLGWGYSMGMNNDDDINELKAEIARLNAKIEVMRGLLWEWNSSSGPVWEYYKLKRVGEKQEDYAFLDDDYEVDMPLFDDGTNPFGE